MKVSLVIGLFAAFASIVLVIVEQVQDHVLDERYQKTRNRKLPIADGYYECQYCGNRKVRESDKRCQVCGNELK